MGAYLGHILRSAFTTSWPIYGYIMAALAIIIAYLAAKHPKLENAMKGLNWKLPLIVFGVLMLINITIIGPYYYDKQRQSQIGQLEQQISNLQSKIPVGLSISSSVGSDPRTYSPNTAEVRITARPQPPYSNTITETILNPNPKFFMYEVVKFTASEGFTFEKLSADIKLPEYFIIQSGYENTNSMIVIINNYPPLASFRLPLVVDTFDKSKEGTEQISTEVIVEAIQDSLQ